MSRNTTLSNALWLVFGRLVQSVLTFLVGILTARYLGPSDYGLIHYAAGFTGFFATFCTLGLPSILVRELTDAPEEEGKILGTALGIQSISSVCSMILILCLVWGLEGSDPSVLTVVGISSVAMVLRSLDCLHCYFQARHRSRITAVVLLSAHGAAMLYKAALLVLGKGVAWFAFGAVLEQTVVNGLLLGAYGRTGGRRLGFSREMARRLLSRSRFFILPGLMVAVYAQTDRIMLTRLLGETATGHYSAAVSLCGSWCFLLSALIDATYPEITEAHRQDLRLFDRRNRQLYVAVLYLSGAVALGTQLLAEPLVRLIYGEAFLPAARPLRILSWYTGFSYLGVARNAWVVCREAQKDLVWVYAMAAAGNVALNLLLIPRWGPSGAAAASLAAQVISAVIAPWLLGSLRENACLMLEALCLKGLKEE